MSFGEPAGIAAAKFRPLMTALLLAWLLALTPCGYSASLSIASQVLIPGNVAITTVSFSGGGNAVGGIQFDVQWDASLAVQFNAGAAVGQSVMTLYTASLGTNSMRCLIIGMNQNTLADGGLVQMFITVNAGSSAGLAPVTLANPIATDPNGEAVALQSSGATVTIQNGSVSQTLQSQGVLNAASLLPTAAAPGEVLTLLGSFSTTSPTVLFNGTPAPVIYSGPGQINAIVPFGLNLNGPADLQVQSQNQAIADVTVPVAAAAPAIFTETGSGSGPGLVFNQDCTLNSWSNPASAGSILVIYGTGFGQMSPAAGDGQILSQDAVTILPVTATIAGVPAEVTYAGGSPGSVAGVFLINVRVPAAQSSALFAPLSLEVGSATTQPGVTVSLQ
jgi:uncharacterized protein (TIGR03437 family)